MIINLEISGNPSIFFLLDSKNNPFNIYITLTLLLTGCLYLLLCVVSSYPQ